MEGILLDGTYRVTANTQFTRAGCQQQQQQQTAKEKTQQQQQQQQQQKQHNLILNTYYPSNYYTIRQMSAPVAQIVRASNWHSEDLCSGP